MQKHNHVELQVEQQYQQHLQMSTTNEKVKKAQCMDVDDYHQLNQTSQNILQNLNTIRYIRESVDSLCRDGADGQYMQYLSSESK